MNVDISHIFSNLGIQKASFRRASQVEEQIIQTSQRREWSRQYLC